MISIAAAIGVFGVIIGSFLNVVIYRIPAGKSLVSPPSSCPRCGSSIKAYDNVPILSWLLLRGRCRRCKEPISVRYPLVELGTGLAFFAVAVLALPPVLEATSGTAAVASGCVLIAYLYFAAVSVTLAMIDLDVRKLPNAIVLPSYVVALGLFGLATVMTGDVTPLLRAVVAAAALAAAYFLMAVILPGGMGMGDVKLAGLLGLYLGWVGWGALIVGALAAFVLGGVFGLILISAGRATRKTGIPFGPWMLGGAAVGIVFGSAVLDAYLSLFGLTAA